MTTITNLFFFMIGISVGISVGIKFILYVQKLHIKKIEKNIEDFFNTILLNLPKISFIKRLNNYVYLRYNSWDIIYLLDKKTISLFDKENCFATSSQIPNSKVIEALKSKIDQTWYSEINNTVTISGSIFSKNIISEYNLAADPVMEKIKNQENIESYSIDDILDKINKVGFENLTQSEKDFLKNS